MIAAAIGGIIGGALFMWIVAPAVLFLASTPFGVFAWLLFTAALAVFAHEPTVRNPHGPPF